MKKWNLLAMVLTMSALFCLATSGVAYSGGVMTDLGTLGGATSQANGINDNGQIVGYSTTASGQIHAFFYTPASHSLPGILPLLLGSD